MNASLSPLLRDYLRHLEHVPELFRRSWDAIAIYDLEGRLVVGNAAARKLVGDDLAETLPGAHYTAHLPLKEAAGAARLFAHVVTSGEVVNTDGTFRASDGSSIPVTIRLVPARVNGEIVGVVGFARDLRAQRSVEAQFVRSEQQFYAIFEHYPDAIAMLDLRSRYTRANLAMQRLTGYAVEELVGQTPGLLAADHRWEDGERILAAMKRGDTVPFTAAIRTKSNERRDVDGRAIPLHTEGQVSGFYLVMQDVTEERRRERQAERSTRRIAELYHIAADPAFSAADKIDRALATGMRELGGEFAYIARVHEGMGTIAQTAGNGTIAVGQSIELRGTIAEQVVETNDLVAVEDIAQLPYTAQLSELVRKRKSFVGLPLHVDAELFVVGITSGRRRLRISQTDRDYVRALASLLASGMQQLQREKRLDKLAFYDPLTGLPNRALFGDRLEQTLLAARRNRRSFAVHYIDVDHFKEINDTYGHHIGDAVLIAVGNWLRSTLRESDTIARIGGDEFVVLQPEIEVHDHAEELAGRLVSIAAHPFSMGDQEVRVTVSVGVAIFPADARNPVDLLRCADEALYHVKARGRNGYEVGIVDA